jgi:hypothetical protein
MELRSNTLESQDLKFEIEAVDLGDLDALEEDIVPCTGCGCTCKSD